MARTLYLENGFTEYIFAGETEADKLQKIIRENLAGTAKNSLRKSLRSIRPLTLMNMRRLQTVTTVC